VTRSPRHPAAYICVARASGPHALTLRRHAIAEAASQRGWPAPAVYADEGDPSLADGDGPALATLIAAIHAGRHDALMVSGLSAIHGGPAYLLPKLLFPCTNHGVAVEFLAPPATAGSP
jgi:DNA invertase Pin-like site-specific DNA recombinase